MTKLGNFLYFQEVLSEFSLRIPASRMYALVGVSGGGKSTVAQLLERRVYCKQE